MRTICASDAGGPLARIRVWRRREDGAIATLELEPDVNAHGPNAPMTFFDEDGRETDRIGSRAAGPGSPEALEAQRRRDAIVGDAAKAEIIPCKDK